MQRRREENLLMTIKTRVDIVFLSSFVSSYIIEKHPFSLDWFVALFVFKFCQISPIWLNYSHQIQIVNHKSNKKIIDIFMSVNKIRKTCILNQI